ncbi:MAG TPA: ABC transporter permease subunit [Methanocella sp.]|nr:ABC transporter permease subunit [Methanocella sp.]
MSENTPLTSSTNYGWTAGFTNMLRKELGRWWNWKSLTVQLIAWLTIINAMVATVLFIVPHVTDEGLRQQIAHELTHHGIVTGTIEFTPVSVANMGVSMFFLLCGMAMTIGAVIFAHDAILKERETGTAAWLLSKPLSRKAFIFAKVLANSLGMMTVILLVQGIITYALCSVELGRSIALLPFLTSLCLMGLDVLFYLLLAMMLGAFTLSRGITLGVPIVLGLVGGELLTLLPDLSHYTPWSLSGMAQAVAISAPAVSVDNLTVLATVAWILLFILAAVWRFEKSEL